MKKVVILDEDEWVDALNRLKNIKWEAGRETASYFVNRVNQLADEAIGILEGREG